MIGQGRATLRAAILLAGVAVAGAHAFAQTTPPQQPPAALKLVKTIDLPGAKGGLGGAIAVDTDTGTVWLAQAPNRNVVVIDTKSNTVRQALEAAESPSGIGFSEHYVFVADAANAAAVVIGKRSLERATTLRAVGARPGGAYFDNKHGTLWVAAANGEMTVFKAVGRGGFKRLAGLRLKPSPPKAAPGTGLYLAIKDRLYQPVDDAIDVINPTNRRVEHVWPIASGGRIASLAYDAKSDRLVAGSEGSEILVIDAKSGKLVAKVPVAGKAGAVAIDPGLHRAYAANAAGTIDLVDLDRNRLLASVASEPGLHALAVDPSTHLVYVYRDQANKVDVLAPQ